VARQTSAGIREFKASPYLSSSNCLPNTPSRTTDASDVGLETILSTEQGTVIEYASWTLTSTENYATIEKEHLAIVWVVRKFRHYLIGAHFVIRTDHKPLERLESCYMLPKLAGCQCYFLTFHTCMSYLLYYTMK